jgi:hypothetical protein
MFRIVIVSVTVAVVSAVAQTAAASRPQAFGPPPPAAPTPSSLLLVLAGLIGLVGWNCWRNRLRRQQTSRDS